MKRRINLRLGLIALIAILATAIGTTMVYYGLFQSQVRADLKEKANLLMETEVFQRAYDMDEASINRLTSASLRITWIDQDGTVLFDNDIAASNLSNHLDRPEIQEAIAHGQGESTRQSDTMGMNTFYYALALENGTVLRVSTQAKTIESVLYSALPVIGIIAVVILLVCALISHLLTRQLMKPIKEMADNLDDRNYVPRYSELTPFAEKIRSQHENVLEAAKSRQDFTANVSHELKTPITAILGYSELMENGMVDQQSIQHIAGQISANGKRLQSLINDIIQLSELDHQDLQRNFTQVNLYNMAKECIREQESFAKQKNVSLALEGVSAGINGDAALIHELLDNLVQNAIRYNKDGGKVTVKVSIENGHSTVSVADTGIGIPASQQERVFERFYRVDKSRSRETGGTGLGLAIVKHIAQIHSANIDLTSQVDQGTKITITF